MEKFNWHDSIRRNIFMLRVLGLWPPGDESYKLNLYTLYAIISILFFVIVNNITETLSIFFVHDDIQAVTQTFFISLTMGISILKIYYLVRNMTMLKQLMTTVNTDMFQVKNQRQLALIQPSLSSWKTAHTVFFWMATAAAVFFSIFPIMDKSVKEHRLPLAAWFPFDYRNLPFYQLAYVYQVASGMFSAGVIVNIDTLIAALNMYIGAQCEILCDELRHIHEFSNMYEKLKECVKHHNAVLRFAEDSNRFFTWIVFVQIVTSVVVLSTTMFQLTMVTPFTSEFFTYILYVNAVLIQIFIYCWFGNEVEIKSKSIYYAAYESDWSDASSQFKMSLVFIIMRAQRPIKISALNFFYLSLETFMTILRTSWSYFAVLQQVNG